MPESSLLAVGLPLLTVSIASKDSLVNGYFAFNKLSMNRLDLAIGSLACLFNKSSVNQRRAIIAISRKQTNTKILTSTVDVNALPTRDNLQRQVNISQ
ncbi:hypothetical protein BDR26DRAFT_135049 [Obelidium mucronatum]|nr:hypothetical protein BDR26DRAFT_135049 [Obelidium mucronatum]